MAERGFQTELWTDPFIQELSPEAKLLFIYLWTNKHCNQAGLYEITLRTIAFDTGLPQESLPEIIRRLEPKVVWYPEQNLIWVKNFLKRQSKSASFLEAAVKSINHTNIPEDIKAEFYLYNQALLQGVPTGGRISLTKRECVLIRDDFRCQYCGREIMDLADYEMDHIIPVTKGGKANYLNLVTSCRDCNRLKVDKTPEEAGLKEPSPTTFHAAQALYILKNDNAIKEKWLRLFPQRSEAADSILFNVEQHYSILPNIESGDAPLPLPNANAVSDSVPDRGRGIVKGEIVPEETTPTSESENGESLSAGDREVISVWHSVKGVKMTPSAAAELVAKLRTDFPDVDILAESKRWAARKLSEPLTKKSRPAGQIWNFMEHRHKWNEEKRGEYEQREARGRPDAHRKDPLQSFRDAGGTVILSGEEAEDGNEDR